MYQSPSDFFYQNRTLIKDKLRPEAADKLLELTKDCLAVEELNNKATIKKGFMYWQEEEALLDYVYILATSEIASKLQSRLDEIDHINGFHSFKVVPDKN
jgi:hypothetical protein